MPCPATANPGFCERDAKNARFEQLNAAAPRGTTIDKAIRIGELLTGVKASLKHGQWLPWIKENLPFDQKTAWRYMHLFDRRDKLGNLPNLTLEEGYKLLSEGKEKTAHVSHKSGAKAKKAKTPKVVAAA